MIQTYIAPVSGQSLVSSDTCGMSLYTDCISVLSSQYIVLQIHSMIGLLTKNQVILE